MTMDAAVETNVERSAVGTLERPAARRDRIWQATLAAGVLQLAGLVLVLIDRHQAPLAILFALAGVAIAGFILIPLLVAAATRRPGLWLVAIGAAGALLVVVVASLTGGWISPPGALLALWRASSAAIVPLTLIAFAATGGLILIADVLRATAREPDDRSPWRRLTTGGASRAAMPWRAVAGVLLIGWAAALAIVLASHYVGSGLQLLVLLSIVAAAGTVIGTPILVAAFARGDRDGVVRAREEERQHVAAHLHDSVLQTLALVQRQANDPAAVARLARRQEHALRSWMAGESELSAATLSAALRAAIDEVEEEAGVVVELSIIGDRAIDRAGEALTAAAREALRNAARHAAGARIFVFAELRSDWAEVFVRDEGPGFELASVPSERRGVRDAIIGRMASAGGTAAVESRPGEGTEVALTIGTPR